MIFETITMQMKARIAVPDRKLSTRITIARIYRRWEEINRTFSTFIPESEVSRYNRGELTFEEFSPEMTQIWNWCRETKIQTKGFFDPMYGGAYDPSGMVKGYAIEEARQILEKSGVKNFTIEIAGDIQTVGTKDGESWSVGISNPFDKLEIIKIIGLRGEAIATSGIAEHPGHILNPFTGMVPTGIVSISVVGKKIMDADRLATAAYAMGAEGINFIDQLEGFEGYAVRENRTGIATRGWRKYELA